jgi:hypothetical protein
MRKIGNSVDGQINSEHAYFSIHHVKRDRFTATSSGADLSIPVVRRGEIGGFSDGFRAAFSINLSPDSL